MTHSWCFFSLLSWYIFAFHCLVREAVKYIFTGKIIWSESIIRPDHKSNFDNVAKSQSPRIFNNHNTLLILWRIWKESCDMNQDFPKCNYLPADVQKFNFPNCQVTLCMYALVCWLSKYLWLTGWHHQYIKYIEQLQNFKILKYQLTHFQEYISLADLWGTPGTRTPPRSKLFKLCRDL